MSALVALSRSLAIAVLGFVWLAPSAMAKNDRYCVEGDCENGTGRWQRSAGDSYQGEWQDGLFHGEGKRVRRSDRYDGGWRNGLRHGWGVHESRLGHYEGGYVDGKRDGWGTFRSANGRSQYTGQWRAGRQHGWGRRVDLSGDVYEGEFRDGDRQGWGLSVTAGRYLYIGQWQKDHYHGVGFWRTSSGDRYVGTFERGRPHGRGVRTRQNGDHYAGEYQDNKRHGSGVEVTADGRLMSGRFDHGMFHGNARTILPGQSLPALGVTAVGCLAGSCQTGAGVSVSKSGEVFAGEWRGGRQDGIGLLSTLDGGSPRAFHWDSGSATGLQLEWARREVGRGRIRVVEAETDPGTPEKGSSFGCRLGDCRSGRGAYAWPDGRVYEGTFRDGRPHGMGQLREPDGSVYLGEWVDARPEGRGTRTGANGDIQDGYWKAGRFAGTARPAAPREAPGPGEALANSAGPPSFGRYHALVIANSRYEDPEIGNLATPARDADALSAVLEEEYGFEVLRLDDATRAQIVSALSSLRRTLEPEDNLLVFYAGHGWLDEKTDEGYWWPVDAEAEDQSQWLSNATIATSLRGIDAKHILVVADSCFSGSLTRGVRAVGGSSDARRWSDLLKLRSRVSLTSGGLEPVLDGGGGGHSVFARALLGALRSNRDVLDGTTLFQRVREQVTLDASQMPSFGNIRESGHEVGGDFVLVHRDRRGSTPAAPASR